MKKKNLEPTAAVVLYGQQFMGIRDIKKVAAIFAAIDEHEQAAVKLVQNTALAYYDAGNILTAALRQWNYKARGLSVKAIAEASGLAEKRITLALKIFKSCENHPDILKGLSLRDALKLIAPPPENGKDGYNRVDLGGDPGQAELDFGELFNLPASANQALQNYRTVGDLLNEIVVVHRTKDNCMVTKSFARFHEDLPQDPMLRMAYKTMSQKTQAAIEDYLSALEQKEPQ